MTHRLRWSWRSRFRRSNLSATAFTSVERLSPIALLDAPAEGSFGFRLFVLPVTVASGSDRLRTIDRPCLLQCRAIVPNRSTRRASGGVFRFSAVWLFGCLTYRLRWLQAPIDRGQSIYHAFSSVERLSPIALHDAPAEASSSFRLSAIWLFDLPVAVVSSSDRSGTIDLPCLLQCRAIVPNRSTRRASGGVFQFSACG